MTELEELKYIEKHIINRIKDLNNNYSVTYCEFFINDKDSILSHLKENIDFSEEKIFYELFIQDFKQNINTIKDRSFLSDKNKASLNDILNRQKFYFNNKIISYSYFKNFEDISFNISFNFSLDEKLIYIDIDNIEHISKEGGNNPLLSKIAHNKREEWLLNNKYSLFPEISKKYSLNIDNIKHLLNLFIAINNIQLIGTESISNIILHENLYNNILNIDHFKNRLIFHYSKVTDSFLRTSCRFMFDFNYCRTFHSFSDLYLKIFLEDFNKNKRLFYNINTEFGVAKFNLINDFNVIDHDFYLVINGDDFKGFIEFYKNDDFILKFSLDTETNLMIEKIDNYIKKDFLNMINSDNNKHKIYHEYIQNNFINQFYDIIPYSEKDLIKINYPSIDKLTYEQIFFKSYLFELFYEEKLFYSQELQLKSISNFKDEIFSSWENIFIKSKQKNLHNDIEKKKRL